jgi:beta-lactamase superfamily II metal-dependent hydrolase
MSGASFPSQGVVFLPVGTGDSTTIIIDDEHVVQVDLHHMTEADDDGSTHTPVIDLLTEQLPERNGHPYLAVFVLTHADEDHCKGFGALLDSDILIGEIWATPRLWREHSEKDSALCEDAERFHKEAQRRIKASLRHIHAGRAIPSGDRLRVIGDDRESDDSEHPYRDLPDEQRSYPGDLVTTIDGDDVSDKFEAFIHAPFKADCAAARNDTSLAMQVTLKNQETCGRILLLGDLAYATLRRIFDVTHDAENDERLAWDVLLAPHHCSRKVMYAPDKDGEEELKQDILDALDESRGGCAYIVASSEPVPATNKSGDNPPHAKAKARYTELGIEEFLCTQEHGDIESPSPVIFSLTPDVGLELLPLPDGDTTAGKSTRGSGTVAAIGLGLAGVVGGALLARAVIKQARGTEAAPVKPVGFGGTSSQSAN